MAASGTPKLEALLVPGGPAPWERAGFACGPDGFSAGAVALRLGTLAAACELVLAGLPGRERKVLDGAGTDAPAPAVASKLPSAHPNGVFGVDHVVLASPDPARTRAALEACGLQSRRTRRASVAGREVLQSFHPAGPCLIELVGPDGRDAGEPASVWGLTFLTTDLDGLAALEPPAVGSIREAVQPGRRIATALPGAGLPLPVAFMDPRESS